MHSDPAPLLLLLLTPDDTGNTTFQIPLTNPCQVTTISLVTPGSGKVTKVSSGRQLTIFLTSHMDEGQQHQPVATDSLLATEPTTYKGPLEKKNLSYMEKSEVQGI